MLTFAAIFVAKEGTLLHFFLDASWKKRQANVARKRTFLERDSVIYAVSDIG